VEDGMVQGRYTLSFVNECGNLAKIMCKSHFLVAPSHFPAAIFAALSCVLLVACAGNSSQNPEGQGVCAPPPTCVCPASPVPAPLVEESISPPVLRAASWAELPGWEEDRLEQSISAFLYSCQGRKAKGEKSADAISWQEICQKARQVKKEDTLTIRRFFETEFLPYALEEADGRREGLITGYYEPLIRGSREKDAQNTIPVLGVPSDLLTIDLGDLYPDLKHRRLRGRLVGNRVIPYWNRGDIEATGENWPETPLLWVSDPVEFFFLQTQGSGQVELADGRRVRIGYADQNGHPYRSIGRVLIERGDLKPEDASMQGIQAWARRNPAKLRALLAENPSYVFFREATEIERDAEEGPLGALGVPLTAERSIAVDSRYIPLGLPVWLATTRPNSNVEMNRLVFTQDTGGAIKGIIRADFFWGFGKAAGQEAGKMRQKGQMWLFLPRDKDQKAKKGKL
jgi:membrane-bound lytic murein transglycosylase A